MNALRLQKLSDHGPVKLAISILPDLHQQLQYHGSEEPIIELIPAMLTAGSACQTKRFAVRAHQRPNFNGRKADRHPAHNAL